jgi:hypothetical protein
MGWDDVRASLQELGRTSEAYLADAYVMERWHPDIAALLHVADLGACPDHERRAHRGVAA